LNCIERRRHRCRCVEIKFVQQARDEVNGHNW
jgi:hypothetical protein